MSSAFLRLQANCRPRPLVGCSTLQHTIISLEICDPNRKLLVEAEMSSDQFLSLMIGNAHVDMTLVNYRDENGNIAHEVPERPKTHRENMRDRLEEINQADSEYMAGIEKTLRAMINGHIKPTKTVLNDLLHQVNLVANNRQANQNYVLTQAEEEINAIEKDLRSGLFLMLAKAGGSEHPVNMLDNIALGDDRALPEAIMEHTPLQLAKPVPVPFPEDNPPLDIPEIPIEKMTADDLANEISDILHEMEKKAKTNNPKGNDARPNLFMPNAFATSNNKHVMITYISYQRSSKVDLAVAREMLRRLRKGEFVRHYEVEREMNS